MTAFSDLSRRPRVWPVLLAVSAFLCHGPLLLGQTYFFADLQSIHFPYREHLGRELAAGRFPLWTECTALGFPLHAEGEGTFWYPGTWLLFGGLPVSWAWNATLFFHYLLAGWGMFALARRLGLSPEGAFLAGLCYQHSGFLTGHLLQLNMLQGAAWLPWVLERLAVPGAWMGLAGALTMLLLSSHPQVIWTGLLLATTLILGGALPRTAKTGKALLCAVPLAGLLALPQLLPTLELVGQSERGAGLASPDVLGGSFPPWHVFGFLFPGAFGTPFQGTYWSLPFWWEFAVYIGVWPLFFSFAGWHEERGTPWRRWRWVMAVFFLLALGKYGPFRWFIPWIPGFNGFRIPGRYVLGAVLPLALFAGKGWDAWQQRQISAKYRKVALWAAAGGAVLPVAVYGILSATWETLSLFLSRLKTGGLNLPLAEAHPVSFDSLAPTLHPFSSSMLLGSTLCLGFAALMAFRRLSRIHTFLALAVIAADVLWFAGGSWPVEPLLEVLRPPDGARFLQYATRDYPLYPPAGKVLERLHPEANLRWGIKVAGFSTTLQTHRMRQLLELAGVAEGVGPKDPGSLEARRLLGAAWEVEPAVGVPPAYWRLFFEDGGLRAGIPSSPIFRPSFYLLEDDQRQEEEKRLDAIFAQRVDRRGFQYSWNSQSFLEINKTITPLLLREVRPGCQHLSMPSGSIATWTHLYYPGWEVVEGKGSLSRIYHALTLVRKESTDSGDLVLAYRPFSFKLGFFGFGLGMVVVIGCLFEGRRKDW